MPGTVPLGWEAHRRLWSNNAPKVPVKKRYEMIVVFVLGGTARNVILPLIIVDFRMSAVLFQPGNKSPGHLDRPHPILCSMAEEQWPAEALDFDRCGRKQSFA
jgi:hypothetical protein